jgi:hypothetical protein
VHESAIGPKRTSLVALHMSSFDPKRKSRALLPDGGASPFLATAWPVRDGHRAFSLPGHEFAEHHENCGQGDQWKAAAADPDGNLDRKRIGDADGVAKKCQSVFPSVVLGKARVDSVAQLKPIALSALELGKDSIREPGHPSIGCLIRIRPVINRLNS